MYILICIRTNWDSIRNGEKFLFSDEKKNSDRESDV